MEQTLTGQWTLAVDPQNTGRAEHWCEAPRPEAQPAPVPGIAQQVFPAFQGVCWYWHAFTPQRLPTKGERARLRFAAVEYLAEVWLNGQPVGGHEGPEFPFELDVTAALRPGENLLAVRVLKPGDERIDGYVLNEIPRRVQRDHARFEPGGLYNVGGIVGPVALALVPEVCLTDLCVRPELGTGQIVVTVKVRNDSPHPAAGRLRLRVMPASGGATITEAEISAVFPVACTQHHATLCVPQHRAWNLDDPVLYRVEAHLLTTGRGGGLTHDLGVRCGFRDFRVVDGFFQLNGRRLFLRSSHTGNHFPVGQILPADPDLMRRDLIKAKAAGFNCIRFIFCGAIPEQLDFCDELGLLVYEETYASCGMEDTPHLVERYERSYRELLRRDRNHPCVVIWGLLNEMRDGPMFRCAVEFLPKLRELDPTRLVLLGSGRWDGLLAIGSVSNPGGTMWETVWGAQGPAVAPVTNEINYDPSGYLPGVGDTHLYPKYPLTNRSRTLLRTLGEGQKPVFLSEFGIGSTMNVIEDLRGYDRPELAHDLADRAGIRDMAERFQADLTRYGMANLYPFPVDFFRDSQRRHSFHRRLAFDLVRSNPQLCGYNLTGLLDHALTGEGLWSFWRRWKPGIVEALEDGWSPLRWCLFVNPSHGYAGRPLELEAVLATEDALPPGRYPVTFRICGEAGVVWERRATVEIPQPPAGGRLPLAVSVLKTRVRLDVPAGEYVFAADLERGGAPTGDRLPFRVADAAALPRGKGALYLWGFDARRRHWLEVRGFQCRAYTPGTERPRGLILVGNVPPGPRTAERWRGLRRAIEAGATVLALSAQPFRGEPADLPWGAELRAREFYDWLYHKEIVGKRHPVFAGLPAGGILDWHVYEAVAGPDLFDCADTPDEVIAAAFAVGYSCRGGYNTGIVTALKRWGKGCLYFNALRVFENLGQHPTADRLLLNLLAYAGNKRTGVCT